MEHGFEIHTCFFSDFTQCYYLGGLEESATGILGEMSKPLSWSMPADKVCEKLKKKDIQICDLRYGKFLCLDFTLIKKLN